MATWMVGAQEFGKLPNQTMPVYSSSTLGPEFGNKHDLPIQFTAFIDPSPDWISKPQTENFDYSFRSNPV
jgi:hypothetical protein